MVSRTGKTIIHPESDTIASSVYLSDDFALFSDDDGRDRRHPPYSRFWNSLKERVPHWIFPEGTITLGMPLVGESAYARVFAIQAHKEWVLKYHAFCPRKREKSDSILREAYFLQLINASAPHITHKIKYLSGPLTPEAPTSLKIPLEQNRCPTVSDTQPIVRYIITERVGLDLLDFLEEFDNERVPFVTAIELGMQIIRLLEQLHSMNIVHGDLHASNIAFRDRSVDAETISSQDNLVLIDFGRARIGHSGRPIESQTVVQRSKPLCHAHLSHWESVGGFHYVPSFRDDIYRGYLVIAAMIYGGDHMEAQMDMCEGGHRDRYRQFKEFDNFFDTRVETESDHEDDIGEYIFDIDSVLPTTLIAGRLGVLSLLEQSLNHIRGLGENGLPDYRFLSSCLERILDMRLEEQYWVDEDIEKASYTLTHLV